MSTLIYMDGTTPPMAAAANDLAFCSQSRPVPSAHSREEDPSCLSLWRKLRPGSIGPDLRGTIVQALREASVDWPADWRHGLLPSVEAATCVSFAGDFLHNNDRVGTRDQVVSVMVVRALDGDIDAAGVVAFELAALAHGHAEHDLVFSLSNDWFRLIERLRAQLSEAG